MPWVWQKKFIFSLVFFLTACNSSIAPTQKKLGFYYWNTIYKSSDLKDSYIDETNSKVLYVRLFDIDTIKTDEGIDAGPISILRLQDSLPTRVEIVPVVYFTRQAIKSIKNVDSFVFKLTHLVHKLSLSYGFTYSEIQWDFDWTPSTRIIYFNLLKSFKQQPEFKNKKFSATIRLHQVKHKSQAGIPPVDKGLLMCYNMGNLKSYEAENSILSLKDVNNYLGNLNSYDLKLDIALPLFSWILHFRDRKFVGIVRVNDSLIQHPNLIKSSSVFYRVESDFHQEGYSFLKNDELRFEAVNVELLLKTAKFLQKKNNNDSLSILFFNLDDKIISNYSANELKTIYDSF